MAELMRMDARAKQVHARLKKICLAWPGTKEKTTWGHPTFRAGEKIFATMGEHEGDLCVTFKPRKEERNALLEDPRVFIPPYVGGKGWLSMRVDSTLEWGELERLLQDSYRQLAPKRLQAKWKRAPEAPA